ncbi:MAG TPA: carboxymuconolactone decarboxylase family protein [Mycobacteriales bacterium]|nr:carboxymuconolactone decarboxylase family protein [Mycobacteriales bacterium]
MKQLPEQPRIAPLPADAGKPGRLNIFDTLRRNPGLYKGFLSLGGYLLGDGCLPAREREIVILRTGWRCGCEYEFGQHTRIGAAAGLSPEEIGRLASESHGGWADDDATLLAAVDEMCGDTSISGPTWQRLTTRWNEPALLELLVLIGFYRLVSGLLNGVGVALEADAAGWPPEVTSLRRAPRDPQP